MHANLRNADLTGADLEEADEGLAVANGDHSTRLPAGISKPDAWRAEGSPEA